MPRGRPTKRSKYNVTGLRNQKKQGAPRCSDLLDDQEEPTGGTELGKRCHGNPSPSDSGDNESESEWDPHLVFMDSTKDSLGGYEPASTESDQEEDDEDAECESAAVLEWDQELENDEFCQKMMQMAVNCGDDPKDENWMPPKQRVQKKRQQANRKHKL